MLGGALPAFGMEKSLSQVSEGFDHLNVLDMVENGSTKVKVQSNLHVVSTAYIRMHAIPSHKDRHANGAYISDCVMYM